MADPRGLMKIEHNGKTYTLEMNFGVLADLEDRHGESFEAMTGGDKPLRMRLVVDTVCLSLMEGTPDLDEAEARRIARKVASVDVFTALVKQAFPDATVEQAGNGAGPQKAA